jgi:hypothetical protein
VASSVITQYEDTIKKLKLTNAKMKAESAAIIFDLKCKLAARDSNPKNATLDPIKSALSQESATSGVPAVDSIRLGRTQFTDENVLNLHSQLTAKNQLILQLSLQLSTMEEEVRAMKTHLA